jgi:hypothetical protein
MRLPPLPGFFALLSLCAAPFLHAADEVDEVASATGTWKWSFTMPDGSKVEPRVKVQQTGDKLTGTCKIRDGLETAISDGRVNGRELSFAVIRERDGHTITTTYHGTRTGNHIKGTIESDWSGEKRTYEWEARRFSRDPAGIWTWSIVNRRGRTNEFKLSLKHEQNEVIGTITFFGAESDIEEGKVKNGDVSFIVVREDNEDLITWKYKGRVYSDSIRGWVEITGGERDRILEWQATRID